MNRKPTIRETIKQRLIAIQNGGYAKVSCLEVGGSKWEVKR